jgi:hypothetical protein
VNLLSLKKMPAINKALDVMRNQHVRQNSFIFKIHGSTLKEEEV